MCGRFTLSTPPETLADLFEVDQIPPLEPRYNIAPGQLVLTVRRFAEESGRNGGMLKWGLVPFWAKDAKIGWRTINARSETIGEKPAFRAAFKKKRCLILADGFYEWKRLEKEKHPYLLRMKDGRPFAFAGLWESWKDEKGGILETCTIITTTPNEVVKEIHDRMPVILDPGDFDSWLDPKLEDREALQKLLKPFAAEEMEGVRISKRVNNPKYDRPDVLDPEE